MTALHMYWDTILRFNFEYLGKEFIDDFLSVIADEAR